MYVKLTNGQPSKFPYTLGELRRDNPQTSFPKHIAEATLAEHDVYSVQQTSAPQIDGLTHRHTQSVELIDGVWTQVWSIVELPLEQASANVRSKRDGLLKDTDWIVIKHTEHGTGIPAEWEAYRQSLRDITGQAGFPYSVTWPVQP